MRRFPCDSSRRLSAAAVHGAIMLRSELPLIQIAKIGIAVAHAGGQMAKARAITLLALCGVAFGADVVSQLRLRVIAA